MKRTIAGLLLCALGISTSSQSAVRSETRIAACHGLWSASGVSLSTDETPARMLIAPGGWLRLILTNQDITLQHGTAAPMQFNTPVHEDLIEVSWAPNDRALSITTSDGGMVGTWDVNLFYLDSKGQIQKRSLDKMVRMKAEQLPQCELRETANLGLLAWLSNGRQAVVLAEVPPHSSCVNMGALEGYRIDVEHGQLLEVISEADVRSRWGQALGCRFRGS